MYVLIVLFFFFSSRRRHTRSLCDWSSDVCSSDLDRDGLIKPCAYVVCAEGAAAVPGLADELKAFVKDSLAPYKYPRWVEFIPELPRSEERRVGKECRARWWRDH